MLEIFGVLWFGGVCVQAQLQDHLKWIKWHGYLKDLLSSPESWEVSVDSDL